MNQKTEQLADLFFAALTAHVARKLAPLVAKIEAIERGLEHKGFVTRAEVEALTRPVPERGEKGERGERGEQGPPGPAGEPLHPDSVRLLVVDEVARAVGILPRAQDGKSVTVEEVRPLLEEMVRLQVASIPAPKDGAPGPAGEPGPAGPQGPQGERGEKGADGAPGERGPQGPAGEPGARGERGEKGLDGAEGPQGPAGERGDVGPQGERGADGETPHQDTIKVMLGELVERAVAALPPPEPGAPGKDADPLLMAKMVSDEIARQFDALRPQLKGDKGDPGAGVKDFGMDLLEDGRTIVFRCIDAEGKEAAYELTIPWQLYRGIYEPGRKYQKGDVVTYAGSTWVALQDTSESPGKSAHWQLAVKRGKDA